MSSYRELREKQQTKLKKRVSVVGKIALVLFSMSFAFTIGMLVLIPAHMFDGLVFSFFVAIDIGLIMTYFLFK